MPYAVKENRVSPRFSSVSQVSRSNDSGDWTRFGEKALRTCLKIFKSCRNKKGMDFYYLTSRGPSFFAFTFMCGKSWSPDPNDNFAGVLSSLGFTFMGRETWAPGPPEVMARGLSSLAFTCICGKTRGPGNVFANVLSSLAFIPELGEGRTSKVSDEVVGELTTFVFIFRCG